MSQFDEVKQAKALHKASLLTRQNVVGVGVGYKVTENRQTDELSVVVMVRNKVPSPFLSVDAMIPGEVDGIRTDVIEVGYIRPLNKRTDRWRPAPGGVSIGHYQITAGTLGCIVQDQLTGARLILSNNHVLANSNAGQPGDPILQPGPADGGRMDVDILARLERFYPLRFNVAPASCNIATGYVRLGNAIARRLGSHHQLQVYQTQPQASNQVDAAVARPLVDSAVQDENLEIGEITGTIQAALGNAVRKSGRSTAITTGEITILDATVSVDYDAGRAAIFEDQIATTAMSQGGDSGSLLVAASSPDAVGLLFAGSSQVTIHNPIQLVMEALRIRIGGRANKAIFDRRTAIERAQAVREAYQEALMSKANVVGVGVGLRHTGGQRTDEVCLVVMVRRKLQKELLAPEDVIPSEIEGVPVDVKEVGVVEALD